METPPFITGRPDGTGGGLEVDMARDIANKLGLTLDIVGTGYFDDVIELVASGKADIGLSNLSITYDRARYVKFTDPYRTLGIILLSNRKRVASMKLPEGVKRLEQLKDTGEPVGVVERSAYAEIARGYLPRAVFKTYEGYLEMIRAAERGEVLMAVGNNTTIESFLKEEPRLFVKLQPFNIEGYLDHIAMAVGPDNDHLLSWLNAYLTVKGLNQR